MKYGSLLKLDDKHKWSSIEVTIGKHNDDTKPIENSLWGHLKSLTQNQLKNIEDITGINFDLSEDSYVVNTKEELQLLLCYKFTSDISRYLLLDLYDLKRDLLDEDSVFDVAFIDILETVFKKGNVPYDIFAYVNFRKRGSPTSWFNLLDKDLNRTISKIDDNIENLCRRLTRLLGSKRYFRFKGSTAEFEIYVISKHRGNKVIRGVSSNLEAQIGSFTFIIFDKVNNAYGIVSGVRREIGEIHNYFQSDLFSEQVYSLRTDLEVDGKELLEKIVNIDEEELFVTGISFKKSSLPNSPALSLKSPNDSSLNEAINSLDTHWKQNDISDLWSLRYNFKGKNVVFYTYGDEWNRHYLNTKAQGRSIEMESEILDKISDKIGLGIKNTRFITTEQNVADIVEKLLSADSISVIPQIPQRAEEVLLKFVKNKVLWKPNRLSKRKCTECHTISWTEERCPNCGKDSMVIIGEHISININENGVLNRVKFSISKSYPEDEINKKRRTRKRTTKNILIYEDLRKRIRIYIIMAVDNKTLRLSKYFKEEGESVIAILPPKYYSKIDELGALGIKTIKIHEVAGSLADVGDTEAEESANLFKYYIEEIKREKISQIYENLKVSLDRLKNKGHIANYNEDLFEIDVTNIKQALVPNVVRLGTEYKGSSIPDGFCGFKRHGVNKLYGWDAKYTSTGAYTLSKRDLRTQKRYIDYLKNNTVSKSIGSLRLYGFTTNSEDISGFKNELQGLALYNKKPQACRIVLIKDEILINLGDWMLENWDRTLELGPKVAETFFDYLQTNVRKRDKWYLIDSTDWQNVKKQLENL